MNAALFKTVPYRDIFAERSDVLVCPVNCCPGVMGKGLALEFAKKYTGLRARHASLCTSRAIKIGRPFFLPHMYRESHVPIGSPNSALSWDAVTRWDNILLFPTKDHWGNPSKLEWIWEGLRDFRNILLAHDIAGRYEITFPALGCGLGGLDFRTVGGVVFSWAMTLPGNYVICLIEPREEQP